MSTDLKDQLVKLIEKHGFNVFSIALEEALGISRPEEEAVACSVNDQAAAVEAKRMELEEAGFDPVDMITREQLAEWLDAGHTYAYIARTFVGLPEDRVAAFGKAWGLRSSYAAIRRGLVGRGRGRGSYRQK
jgi:hypothetical protein